MAPLDFLRRNKPKTAAPKPRGESGRFHTDGFLDFDEINAALTGPRGIEKFDEMWRTDGDCRRALTMVVTPIVAGTWTVEPFADDEQEPTTEDEEVAAFVEWALTEHMRPKLNGHLWQAMTVAGRAGFAPFEQVYERARWRDRDVITLATLDLRLPKTIQRWPQSGHELQAVEQYATSTGATVLMAREDLVYYRFGAEGDNWEGQALDAATPIPTPDGWRTMGDLQPGDRVFDERGAIRHVTARRDWTDRPCYAVHLSSGETVIADANHQWLSHTHKARHRGGEPELLTTEQMATSLRYGGVANHALPLTRPVDHVAQHLPIDPYVLGYWLGDGNTDSSVITSADPEVADEFTRRGFPTTKAESARYRWKVGGDLQFKLRALGVLGNKHVPAAYLHGSIAQRLDLLRGLMDSDGNVGGKRDQRAEFSNTNCLLADAVMELVWGLGGRGTVRRVNRAGVRAIMGRDCRVKDVYRVCFHLPEHCPFWLPRKADRYDSTRARARDFHYVESIVAVSRRGTICIEVDSPSHLFLCGRTMVPTHNSLLRPAYKHWRMKDAIERIQAIGIERASIGIPTGYPPTGASTEDLATFEDFLENVRANDSSYFLAPGPRADHMKTADGTQGWFWEFVTPSQTEGAATAIDAALKYHKAQIDGVVVAEFMRLGQQGEGARATADVQQDPFYAFCEALASIVIEDEINEALIPRLVDLNFESDRYPQLKCSLIDSTSLEQLAAFVSSLAEKGAIRVEPTLEAYLRDRADLPPADEDAIKEREEQAFQRAQEMAELAKPKPGDKDDDDRPPGRAARGEPPKRTDKPAQLSLDDPITLARQDRELRAWEQAVSLDRIEASIDGARERFEQAAGTHARALAVALARKEPDADGVVGADAVEAMRDLRDAIEAELEGLYLTGRATVVEELGRQRLQNAGFTLAAGDPPGEVPPGERRTLAERAKAAAEAIRAAAVAAVAAARFRRGAGAAVIQANAEASAMAALRGQAMEHASGVLNAGRTHEAEVRSEEIAGSRYTSILDGRRCPSCAAADDDVLRPLDDPVRLARIPPNPDCHGGGRCRCLEAYELLDEAPSYA